MSKLMKIYPYYDWPHWVFDDKDTGLKAEPFVFGASEMIMRLVRQKRLQKAGDGFELSFGAMPFDHDVRLRWLDRDTGAKMISAPRIPEPLMPRNRYNPESIPAGGNFYEGKVAGKLMAAWLCPALLLYFGTPPKEIFVKAAPLPPGINPIWQPKPSELARRLIEPTIERKT